MLECLTFSSCVSQFILDRKTRECSPRTINFYQSELRYFGNWLEDNESECLEESLPNSVLHDILNLTSNKLREWFVSLSSHRNKGGVHASFRTLKCFLNWLTEENDLEWKNPILKVKVSPSKLPPLPEIPIDDIQTLLNACTGRNELRDKAVLRLLVDSGVRANEAVSLNISDIDLVTGKVVVSHGKGDKFRLCYVGDKTKRAIKEYLKTRTDNQQALFLNEDGERLKFVGLRQLVIRLCDRTGIQFRGLHSFRRCFALTLWRKTGDLITVSRLLGHSNTIVTARYINLGNADLQKAHSLASPGDDLA